MSKTAAIFTANTGHASLAEAVQEALQNNYQIKIFKTLFEEIPLAKTYIALYQFFPSLNQIPFKAMANNNKATESARKITRLKCQKKIKQFFNQHQPEVLINTYGFYNSCLEDLQSSTQKPLINVLADPKTPLPLTISQDAAVNLTFADETQQYCRQYYPEAKYKNSGWFVRDRFETDYDQTQVRQELKLDPEALTFLVASGSEGTNLVMKVLPTLIKSPQPIQVIIACGNNKILFESIKTINLFLDDAKGDHNQLIPLKFTDNIHQYMQAADYQEDGGELSLAERAVAAIMAGNNILIFGPEVTLNDLDQVMTALTAAYEAEPEFQDQVATSLAKIKLLKTSLRP